MLVITSLRQRLPVPTLLVLLALLLVGGCGGQASTTDKAETQQSTDKTEKQEKTSTPEPPLALIPLAIDTSSQGADPGWQKVSVDLGVVNNSSTPQLIQFPKAPSDGKKGKGSNDGKGKGPSSAVGRISIEEGREYDVKVTYPVGGRFGSVPASAPFEGVNKDTPKMPYDGLSSSFSGFSLPPGFALCGIVRSPNKDAETRVLRAEGQIPHETTPSSLSVNNYPSVDLTSEPSRSSCAPKGTTSLPTDSVTLSTGNSEATLRPVKTAAPQKFQEAGSNEIRVSQALELHTELQNQNNLDNFTVDDLGIWAIDEDGVGRVPHEYGTGTNCDKDYYPWTLPDIRLGPSQSATLIVCFSHRENYRPVAFVIQSPRARISEVIGAPAHE